MSQHIDQILAFNKQFVDGEHYKSYSATKIPSKKIAILACMDARMTELLPAALNLKNGEAKIIKNAGAVITHPFGSVMRSLLVAVYELGVEDIMIIGHYDCGVQGLEAPKLIKKMTSRGISQDKIDFVSSCGINVKQWLTGFEKIEDSVVETVKLVKGHPLMPADVRVHGFVIDPASGRLDRM